MQPKRATHTTTLWRVIAGVVFTALALGFTALNITGGFYG